MTVGPTTKGRTNRVVSRLLRSPAHRVLSRWLCLIEYEGRSSGRSFRTPTQYAESSDGRLLVFVGSHEQKRWWRNFTGAGGPIRVWVRGAAHDGHATAFLGTDQSAIVDELLAVFFDRFPRAAKMLLTSDDADQAVAVGNACVVEIRLMDSGARG